MLTEESLRVLYLFLFSVVSRHLSGDLFWWERASVFTTQMSWILSVPLYHSYQISRSYFCSDVSLGAGWLLGRETLGWSFPYCTAQLGWIRRLLRTCNGVKGLPSRLTTPSRSLLWKVVMSHLFFKSNAGQTDNATLHPSQWGGRSGGSMLYPRKRASLHSWSPKSVPFTV